jgi:hypothetical protein
VVLVLLLVMQRMKGFESDGYRRTVSGLSHPLRSGMDAHTSASLNEVQ